jgi:hypothetical protein
MYRSIILFVAFCILGGHISAHQFTPTYPVLEQAPIPGVKVLNMSIFNNRKEIAWYSINVYDKDWNNLAFASTDKLINLNYLERKNIEVYVRTIDSNKVVYICSKSKTLASVKNPSIITSRICSKVKNEVFNINSSLSGVWDSLGRFKLYES